MPSSFIIKQFAATGSPILQDHSVRLSTPDNLFTLVDMSNTIKPNGCYLVTISQIGTEQIIIEGDNNVEEKQTEEDQENSTTNPISEDGNQVD